MPTKNKIGRARAASPTIPEIRLVIEDTIQVLIESFSEFGPKDRGLVTAKGISAAAEIKRVRSPGIRREIACLQRALEILTWVEELDYNELAALTTKRVPRGTNITAP